jgi:hypothetical protein
MFARRPGALGASEALPKLFIAERAQSAPELAYSGVWGVCVQLEPSYVSLNGIDPVVFIMSSNERRRHMKLGQRAMIAAKSQKTCFIK